MTVKDIVSNVRDKLGDLRTVPQYEGIVEEYLWKLYADTNTDNILNNHSDEKILRKLNLVLDRSLYPLKNRNEWDLYMLTHEELEYFLLLAKEASEKSMTDYAKEYTVLTTNEFLKMARVLYDAAENPPWPEEISTTYLYCYNRMEGFSDERIFKTGWDDPKQFASKYRGLYHPEELWFGGPHFYIKDLKEYDEKGYQSKLPETNSPWTATIAADAYFQRETYRGIKMFIALREHGYPVYFYEYEKAYKAFSIILSGEFTIDWHKAVKLGHGGH